MTTTTEAAEAAAAELADTLVKLVAIAAADRDRVRAMLDGLEQGTPIYDQLMRETR